MKKILCAISLFLGAVIFCAASGTVEETAKGSEKAETSYAFGMVVAADLLDTGIDFNLDSFIRGFLEVMEDQETRYTMDEAYDIIEMAFEASRAEMDEVYRAQAAAFLAENGKRPGVITTPSGLQYEVINEGSGQRPGPVDMVLVHYQGAFIDGNVFDSTYMDGEPMELPLDRVIPGWSEGLRMMREGERAILFIPPHLAYGEWGTYGIPPYSVLVFDVEFIAITGSSSD